MYRRPHCGLCLNHGERIPLRDHNCNKKTNHSCNKGCNIVENFRQKTSKVVALRRKLEKERKFDKNAQNTIDDRTNRQRYCFNCQIHGKYTLEKDHKKPCEWTKFCKCSGCKIADDYKKALLELKNLRKDQKEAEEEAAAEQFEDQAAHHAKFSYLRSFSTDMRVQNEAVASYQMELDISSAETMSDSPAIENIALNSNESTDNVMWGPVLTVPPSAVPARSETVQQSTGSRDNSYSSMVDLGYLENFDDILGLSKFPSIEKL